MIQIDPTTVPASPAELLALLAAQCACASELLAHPLNSFMPTLAVMTRQPSKSNRPDQLLLIALDVSFNASREKREAMLGIGRRLYAEQYIPSAAVLVSEAWVAPDVTGRQPADHPERREAIVAAGSSLGGRHAVMRTMIVSRADGHIVPGAWDEPQTDGVTPILVNHLWKGFFEAVTDKYGMPPEAK